MYSLVLSRSWIHKNNQRTSVKEGRGRNYLKDQNKREKEQKKMNTDPCTNGTILFPAQDQVTFIKIITRFTRIYL